MLISGEMVDGSLEMSQRQLLRWRLDYNTHRIRAYKSMHRTLFYYILHGKRNVAVI